jgi:hypothetical protein
LENDLLKLTEKLIPPQSAYTQSGKNATEENKGGAPTKEPTQKTEKTEQNKEALEK